MNERKHQQLNNQCLDMGLLVRLRDNELSPDEVAQARTHLALCPDCAADERSVATSSTEVYNLLDTLSPSAAEKPDSQAVHAAFARLQAELKTEKHAHVYAASRELEAVPITTARRTPLSQNKGRNRRYAWWATAVAAALIALLVLPNASVLAEQFLSLFQPKQFQPVSVNPQTFGNDLYSYLRNFSDTQISFERPTDLQNATPQQAKQYVNFPLLLPTQLPTGVGNVPHFHLISSGKGTFTFDVTKARAYLKQTGQGNMQIPTNLDGATFTINSDAGMIVNYSTSCRVETQVRNNVETTTTKCSGGNPFYIVEIPSPVVQATGKASLKDLSNFLLSLPNLSPSVRAMLQNLDLEKGIVPLPLPSEVQAQHTTVRGVPGVLLLDASMKLGGVVWQTNGIIYMIGTVSTSGTELLNIANSLQ